MIDEVGTQLFRQVEAAGLGGRLAGLSHGARAVLFVIAMNAHDTGTPDAPPRTYFRGWEHLARAALGFHDYTPAAERAVGRAIRELVDAGLIKGTGRRHGMRHAPVQYEVTL